MISSYLIDHLKVPRVVFGSSIYNHSLKWGDLFMPTLLFPPLRFQNSKFGIGKNRQKLTKNLKVTL